MSNQQQPMMTMMIQQVFVKLINGESKAINFNSATSSSPITSDSIKHRLYLLTGIPTSSQILLSGSRPFNPTHNPIFPLFCTLVFRLRGGKGGFGSLLRGAATKAGHKKTNNFDACRDMSGRRLRHVNAEKRLEEWKAEAEERGLEKMAEEFLKKKMKAEGKKKKEGGGAETEKYVSKYREDSARCMEVVEKSVREALGKKRKVKEGNGGYGSKKLKIWMGKRKVDNSDGDDSEDDNSDDNEEHENGNSIVLDAENHLESIRETEGSSDSVTGGKMDNNSSAGGSSGNSSDGDEEIAIKKTSINFEISAETMVEETVQQKEELSLLETTVVSETEAVKNDYATVAQPPSTSSFEEGETLECGRIDDKMSFDIVPKPVLQEEIVSKSIIVAIPVKPLNFEEFNSSAELEALGMETLKLELQSHGLKCGGTLQERAARLFLLKTTPLDKLPKKLLAKK